MEETADAKSARTPNVRRLPYIDTLRGFAACWVFFLHVTTYWPNSGRATGINLGRAIELFFGMGGLGVDLFIVLSGFCLFYPLIRDRKTIRDFDTGHFYRRRIFRLLPAYYAALAIATALVCSPLQPYISHRAAEPLDVVSYSLLVQTFSLYRTPAINGSMWSIALEAQLYIVFPIVVLVFQRFRMGAVIGLALLSGMLWPVFHKVLVAAGVGNFDPQFHFPALWIEFTLGMLAAYIVAHCLDGMRIRSLAVFGAGIPLTLAFSTGLLADLEPPPLIGRTFAGITFAALVVFLATLPERLFLENRYLGGLTWIGGVSFSLYLVHQPLLAVSAPLAGPFHVGNLSTLLLSAVTIFPLTVVVAFLFYKYIESPFLNYGRSAHKPSIIADQAIP